MGAGTSASQSLLRNHEMTPLFLLLVAGPPAGDWAFVDEAARDGRGVVTFRTVEMADAPTRPLHPGDTPPAGAKFGSVGVGPGGRHRPGVGRAASAGRAGCAPAAGTG